MKRLLLSAVGILALISCQSDQLDSKATREFQPILQLSKGQTAEHFADSIRNWYFATASARERYIFWQEKINLDIEHMALEADQRTYVLEIFQELEPEHFRNGYNPS